MANPHELSQAAHDRLVAELEELRVHHGGINQRAIGDRSLIDREDLQRYVRQAKSRLKREA